MKPEDDLSISVKEILAKASRMSRDGQSERPPSIAVTTVSEPTVAPPVDAPPSPHDARPAKPPSRETTSLWLDVGPAARPMQVPKAANPPRPAKPAKAAEASRPQKRVERAALVGLAAPVKATVPVATPVTEAPAPTPWARPPAPAAKASTDATVDVPRAPPVQLSSPTPLDGIVASAPSAVARRGGTGRAVAALAGLVAVGVVAWQWAPGPTASTGERVAASSTPTPAMTPQATTRAPTVAAREPAIVVATPAPAPVSAPVAPAAPPAPATVAPSFVAGAPTVGLASDDPAASRLIGELSRPTGSPLDAQVAPVVAGGWQQALAALRTQGQTRVALVRYDALRAARGLPAAQRVPLEVVAPVEADRIHFVVRADSPLAAIHDIEGKRIAAGAVGTSGALTAGTVYRAMFGKAMPVAVGNAAEAPLGHLRDGSADVAVVVGDWKPAEGAGAFKLLRLEASDPRAARAGSSYLRLPADKRDSASVPTFGVVSFLVASPSDGASREAHERAVAAFASTLCRQRPRSGRAEGDVFTGRIDPKMHFDVGLPWSNAAQAAFALCDAPSGATAAAKPPSS